MVVLGLAYEPVVVRARARVCVRRLSDPRRHVQQDAKTKIERKGKWSDWEAAPPSRRGWSSCTMPWGRRKSSDCEEKWRRGDGEGGMVRSGLLGIWMYGLVGKRDCARGIGLGIVV